MIQHPTYTFQNTLGKGGMATVWLAEHNTLHKPVAIKVLNKEFVHNENIRKRFLAEARNLFGMSHPNIIKVTDLIDQDDLVAFVMEYIEGQTLKNYLDKKGKLTDEDIKDLFGQMLDAVGYVHEQGLIHRDIKPSNFMITGKRVIKLLDFGIAKNTDLSSAEYTMTGTSQNMGTPMYMSPEQIKSTKDVTSQTDIYSLGVVLWQIVMGRRPYDTETLSTYELQTKIVTEPLSPTGTKFDIIIHNSTKKDPEKRSLNAKDFLSLSKQNAFRANQSDDRTIFVSKSDKTITIQNEPANRKTNISNKELEINIQISPKQPILKPENAVSVENALINKQELLHIYSKWRRNSRVLLFFLLIGFLGFVWFYGGLYLRFNFDFGLSSIVDPALIELKTLGAYAIMTFSIFICLLMWDIPVCWYLGSIPRYFYYQFVIYFIGLIVSVILFLQANNHIFYNFFFWPNALLTFLAIFIIVVFSNRRKILEYFKEILLP